MAKAKAPAKQQTKAKAKAENHENGVETNGTPEVNLKSEETKKQGRAKPAKAEAAAPTVEAKPKRAPRTAKSAKAKEESEPEEAAAELQTNGVEKSKPAKKPASKSKSVEDVKGRGKKQEQPAEAATKKRARKAESKDEEQPPKKRGKKEDKAADDDVEDEKMIEENSENDELAAESPKKKKAATKTVKGKTANGKATNGKAAAAAAEKSTKSKVADAKSPEKPAATQKSPKKPAANAETKEEPEVTGVTGKKLQNSVTSDYNIDFNIKEAFKTKIVTWNVAGIRACAQKGCVEYLRREDADIICLNELKVGTEKDIPNEVKLAGYYPYWNISKGNPGVAILSKKKPIKVTNDLPEKFTTDNRLITAEYDDFYLVSCYVVNAGRGLKTLDKRMEWNAVFDKYIQQLDKEKPVIIAGDLNVAHNEIDLANPKTNHKSAGFTKEERDGFSQLLSYGFIDTFRAKNPEQKGAYTFWSYMGGARAKNVGWRLDYFVTSERFMDKVVDSVIRSTIKGSDHCPIVLFMN